MSRTAILDITLGGIAVDTLYLLKRIVSVYSDIY